MTVQWKGLTVMSTYLYVGSCPKLAAGTQAMKTDTCCTLWNKLPGRDWGQCEGCSCHDNSIRVVDRAYFQCKFLLSLYK